MEKEGLKIVSIANADDKRQLTTVLAVTATGEYVAPQILYKGKKQSVTHRSVFKKGEMSGALITTGST